ncbi:hypothetical protein AgCh_025776 [Apium graveolens]
MQILIDEVRGSGNEGEAKTLTQVLLDLNEAKPDYYKDDVIMSLMQCFNWDRISEEMVDMTEGHGLFTPKVVTLKAKCAARPRMYAKDVDDLIQFGTSGNVAGFICEAIQELVVLLNWLQVTCLRKSSRRSSRLRGRALYIEVESRVRFGLGDLVDKYPT